MLMMISLVLTLVLMLVLGRFIIWPKAKLFLFWRRQPPGPADFPLVGSLWSLSGEKQFLIEGKPHKALRNICLKYGRIMKLGLGPSSWVVLSGMEEIKEYSMMDDTISRPSGEDLLIDLYSFGKRLGVIMAHGELWKEQRKFMMKGVLKGGPLDEQILEEVSHSIDALKANFTDDKEDVVIFKMEEHFDYSCLNVIWKLASGRRFDYADQQLRKIIDNVGTFTQNPILGPLVTNGFLTRIPPFKSIYQEIQGQMRSFQMFLRSYIKQVLDDRDGSEHSMDGYIGYFQNHRNTHGGPHFSTEQLIVSIEDFFTGGSGTVSKTLGFAIYYLVHHESIQTQVREEIMRVIHADDKDVADFTTISQIPLVQAIMMEVQRMGSVLPIAPPRVAAKKDVEVAGYVIKEGVPVQINLYALHRDPEHWGDPDVFRPHRFIDENGQLKLDSWLNPFGYGKRKCIGETLAKRTILLFLTNYLINFKFTKMNNQYEHDACLGGLTISPPSFAVRVSLLKN